MWKVRLSSVTPKHPQIDAQHVNRGALMRQVILGVTRKPGFGRCDASLLKSDPGIYSESL